MFTDVETSAVICSKGCTRMKYILELLQRLLFNGNCEEVFFRNSEAGRFNQVELDPFCELQSALARSLRVFRGFDMLSEGKRTGMTGKAMERRVLLLWCRSVKTRK